MKKWPFLLLVAIVAMPLFIFRFSPHGGLVPFWTDTTGMPKYSGGDGSSLTEAIVIRQGSSSLSKNYEIEWLWKHDVHGVDFQNFKAEKISANGSVIERVDVTGHQYYFDISQLRAEPDHVQQAEPFNTGATNQTSLSALQQDYIRQRDADRSYDWKRPISFYGKVVDQHDTPVADARVELDWSNLSIEGGDRTNITTDSNGSFSFQGTGKSIGVLVSKDGFSRFRQDPTTFEYADAFMPDFHRPEPQLPVIFHLYKHSPVPLISSQTRSPLSHDGTEWHVTLDLKRNGRGPNFFVKSWTEARTVEKPLPDWRVEISSDIAELVTSAEEFPFEAPETGYEKELKWDMPSSDARWKPDFDESLYFRTTEGLYGRIHIAFLTWGDGIRLEYWVNPTGARLLDSGRSKQPF